MPSLNAHNTVVLISAYLSLVNAYVISTNGLTHPTSLLASKVVFQSPSDMENIYKEFIVSSKPLSLRKYANGLKTKKTKKDSQIFYIPIPPLPYRYTPGIGYDYQPMKINSIMKEMPSPVVATNWHSSNGVSGYGGSTPQQQNHQQHQQQLQQQQQYFSKYPLSTVHNIANSKVSGIVIGNKTDTANGESKIFHLQRDYFYNGRPLRLQVAHAQPKHKLTPQNLKSKLFFNKNLVS